MSKGVRIGNVIKHSISLSPEVNEWAQELAQEAGYGTNFSAYFADLIRQNKKREERERAKYPATEGKHFQINERSTPASAEERAGDAPPSDDAIAAATRRAIAAGDNPEVPIAAPAKPADRAAKPGRIRRTFADTAIRVARKAAREKREK